MLDDPRWHKVIRDLWDHKSRTSLVVLSIAIGVFAFGGLFIAREIAIANLSTQIAAANLANITMRVSDVDDTLVAWVSRQEHVTGAQGRAVHTAQLVTEDTTYNLTLNVVDDYEDMQIDRIRPQGGTWPPGRGEILFERTSAPLVGAQIGQTVVIEQPPDQKQYELTFAGVIHDLNAPSPGYDQRLTAYVSFNTLTDMGYPRRYNQLEITIDDSIANSGQTTGLAGSRAASSGLIEMADSLQSELRRRDIAVTSVQLRPPGEHWASDVLSTMMTILVGMGLFSLILSGFLVVNIISGLLVQQTRQIGMLKVVGATNNQVIGIYLIMVTALGLLALFLALPASLGLAYAFLLIVVQEMNFDILSFPLPLHVILLEAAMALLTPLVAAFLPILAGTRLTAAEAISDHVAKSRNRAIDRLLSWLRGLSDPIMFAVRNTFRHQARLFMSMTTLILAGTLFISVINVRRGIGIEIANSQRMSDFDVELTFDGAYDRAGLERRAEMVSGVAHAEGWAVAEAQRIRPGGDKSETFPIYGLPHDSLFVKPTIQAGRWLQARDRYDIVVSNQLLRDEKDVRVGDEITLELNYVEHDWTVVGVVETWQPVAYADYGTLTHVQDMVDRTGLLLVRTEQSSGPFQDTVAEALKEYLDDRGFTVVGTTTHDEIISGISEGYNVLVYILLGLAFLVVLVGGLGLTGLMSLNVLERTREIGVLRSVGAANGPIRTIVLIEGAMVGFLSWAAALPISVPASRAFDNLLGPPLFGHPLAFTYAVAGSILWLVIVLSVSATASLMPAQRACRISVREALAYE